MGDSNDLNVGAISKALINSFTRKGPAKLGPRGRIAEQVDALASVAVLALLSPPSPRSPHGQCCNDGEDDDGQGDHFSGSHDRILPE
jgi:hypothetical protein